MTCKFKYLLFRLWMVLILFTTCQKEEITSRIYPRVQTISVSEINKSGALFNAEIINTRNINDIIEFGFVWSDLKNPSYENSDRVSKKGPAKAGKYSCVISTTLKENVPYYSKSFVKTNDFIVYGKEISFVSLGSKSPVINDFFPRSAKILDTIYISGKNFSYKPASNMVQFDTLHAKVIKSSDSLLLVLVPEFLGKEKCTLSVSILGNMVKSGQQFSVKTFQISDFNPKTGTFLDILTVSGSNLPVNSTLTKVLFGSSAGEIIEMKEKYLTCRVPAGIDIPEVIPRLKFGEREVLLASGFRLIPPELHSFKPEEAINTGEIITITGNYFNPVPTNNLVFFKGKKAAVLSSSKNELKVAVPADLVINKAISQRDSFKLSLSVSQQVTLALQMFTFDYHSTWTRKADFPGEPRIWPVAFSFSGKGYYGLGSYDFPYNSQYNKHYGDLWEYNPVNNGWRKITTFPADPRGKTAHFVIDHKLYLCCGVKGNYDVETNVLAEVWEFDLHKNTWTRKKDFPGGKRFNAFGFTINGMGYLGGGANNCCLDGFRDFWQYDPVHDSWKPMGQLPDIANFYITRGLIGFNTGTSGYMGFRDKHSYIDGFWKYNDNSKTWQALAPHPGYYQNATGFVIGESIFVGLAEIGSGYLVYQGTQEFRRYNIATNSWTDIGFAGPPRFAAGAFAVDGKGYVCGGFHNSDKANLVDLWMYDPGK